MARRICDIGGHAKKLLHTLILQERTIKEEKP